MKFIEFTRIISGKKKLYPLTFFYLEEQKSSPSSFKKSKFSPFYNANYQIEPFYKNIHRLL